MIFGRSGILGLAISQHTIACAEIGSRGGKPVVRARALFEIPPELAAGQPDALGNALAKFLRHEGFSCSRAVVGIPAKWLIAMEKEVPPSDEPQMQSMLRLQVERMSNGDGGEMVFDYAGQSDRSRGGKVLLVGVLRRQLERIEGIADAAGLSVVGVTSTGLAMASAMTSGDADASVLLLSRQGGEMIWRHEGATRMLRHIPLTTVNGESSLAMTAIGSELRRAVAMSPLAATNGQSAAGSPGKREIVLWDLLGLEQREVDELSTKLGLLLRVATADSAFGLQQTTGTNGRLTSDEPAQAAQFAPAISVALAGARRALPVDLAHSRLAPPPVRRVSRTTALAIACGAVVLIGIGSLVYDVKSRQSELSEINAQLASHADERKNAEATVARFDFGRGFFDRRTPALECMRELWSAFRDDEPIWVTSFTFRENRTGQVSGKATDQRFVISVYDRMKKDTKFADVTPPDMNDAGSRTREVAFTIRFRFTGSD